jgi:hypothetical protein
MDNDDLLSGTDEDAAGSSLLGAVVISGVSRNTWESEDLLTETDEDAGGCCGIGVEGSPFA